MILQEEVQKRDVLKELIRGVHMPSFCDEEGRCEALDEGEYVDASECSCCNINRIVRAFNRGIEFQKQKSPWISIEKDLPCNHEELLDAKCKTKKVLVLKFGDFPDVDYMLKVDGKWTWFAYKNSKFWMPIPKLPKE